MAGFIRKRHAIQRLGGMSMFHPFACSCQQQLPRRSSRSPSCSARSLSMDGLLSSRRNVPKK
eukprot:1149207-Pelagomonas_calceolata.AAC.1